MMRTVLVPALPVLLVLAGCVAPNGPDADDSLTFQVKLPANTGTDDLVFINLYRPEGIIAFPMERDGFVATRSFPLDLLETRGAEGRSMVDYRYDRNGAGQATMEYIADDAGRETMMDGSGLGRSAPAKAGHVQVDTVDRWRWMPSGDVPVPIATDLVPAGEWTPRTGDAAFRSGQLIEDLYAPRYDAHFDAVASRLQDAGFGWVTVAPPWQWIDDDPPAVGNALELGVSDQPNYPDDAKLIAHIQAFQRAGLQVHLAPQICCEPIDTRDRTSVWWNAYAEEVERFVVHHAALAEANDVASFLFEPFDAHHGVSSDRIDEMLQAVRGVYSGEVATSVQMFIVDGQNQGIIPTVDDLTWGAGVDLFVLATDAALIDVAEPTPEDLRHGAGGILDAARPLYETYGRPVVLQSAYWAVAESWRGGPFYSVDGIPDEQAPEDDYGGHAYSGHDQARVLNAYMEAIGERPWVVGHTAFGYRHWPVPTYPHWSVSGKEAESLLTLWNEAVPPPPAG